MKMEMEFDPVRHERLVVEALFYRHRTDAAPDSLFRDLAAVKHDALLRGDAYELRQDYERLCRLPWSALEDEHARRASIYRNGRTLERLS